MRWLAVVLLPAAAQAMDVASFLSRAHALQARGALLAVISPDYAVLKGEVLRARDAWHAQLAKARPAVCAPPDATLTRAQVMTLLEAVPPARQPSTEVSAALVAAMNDRYRCRP